MDKLACMKTFCAVVKEGGFSAAALWLGTSKVVVSRQITHLKNELGLRLLQRTTRKMSPTDDGLAYYERCLTLLDDFDELDSAIKERRSHATGRLRMAVPSEAFTSRHLLPFFVEFAGKYPQVELDIALSDRYVDIVEEGFDAALRIGRLDNSSLIARKLADMEIVLCASPRYLNAHPAIKHPKDIEQHPVIMDSNFRGGQSCDFSFEEEKITVKMNAKVRINSSLGVNAFLKQGFGLGLCPSFMVTHELESGEFMRILPDWHVMSGGIYIVYSHRKHLSARVSLLVAELSQYFERRRM